MKILFILAIAAAGLFQSGCAVPVSSFNPPEFSHEQISSFHGTWRGTKKQMPETVTISDYVPPESFFEGEKNPEERRKKIRNFQKEVCSVSVIYERKEGKRILRYVPLMGYFFRNAGKTYLVVTWDFPGVAEKNRYDLFSVLCFSQAKFYILELSKGKDGTLKVSFVDFWKTEKKGRDEIRTKTAGKSEFFEDCVLLNSSGEIAKFIREKEYVLKDFGTFIPVR